MNNSNSQKPRDNSILFANCAKEWDSYEHKETHVVFENAIESILNEQDTLNEQDSQSDQHEQERQKEQLIFALQGGNYSHSFNDDVIDTSMENPLLTRLHSVLELALTQYVPLSHSQSEIKAQELLFAPQKNYNWHLCLMGYHANNISTNLNFEENELHDPLEGIVKWLTEGMKKSWLRYVDMDSIISPLHYSFLSQEVFWQRFVIACETRRNRLSLVLFKFADAASKKMEIRELIEQILIATKSQDFFGEIRGVGVALVLPNSGSFGATACAECIMSRMENSLNLQNISITVGVAEAGEGENADILFAHTKEVLTMKPKHGLKVHVYSHTKKDEEKKSLVQSEEKRFLFFGVQ